MTTKREKKILLPKKVELGEKIRDFEQKGLSWLEPAREFVLSLNQAANLVESENKEEMTTFLKNNRLEPCFRKSPIRFCPQN